MAKHKKVARTDPVTSPLITAQAINMREFDRREHVTLEITERAAALLVQMCLASTFTGALTDYVYELKHVTLEALGLEENDNGEIVRAAVSPGEAEKASETEKGAETNAA
jgi:hypothetical protein